MRRFLPFLLLLCIHRSTPAQTLLVNPSCTAPSFGGCTTTAADTTGANFLVASIGGSSVSNCAMSDSKSNSWTALTPASGTASTITFYSTPTTVGSGHTFTVGTCTFASMVVSAWSGMVTMSVFQTGVQSQATGTGSSIQPGSVTPSGKTLLISALSEEDTTTQSINSGFTIIVAIQFSNGNYFGVTQAYLKQASGAAVNPTWSWTNSAAAATTQAAFTASSSSNINTQVGAFIPGP